MGRFKSEIVRERKFDWGKIIFNSKYCITVETKYYTVIFHRYGAAKGNYAKFWSKFRRMLLNNKINNVYEIYKWAARLDVSYYIEQTKLFKRSDTKIE